MIAGLETPTAGDVLIDGERVTDRPPRDRDLSMVFQNLALWDHKTVGQNIGFGLKMDGVGADERRAAVQEVAEVLHIEEKLDQSPAELSGGQRQRVALGRSLVREPDVVLLDEPLSSLDAKLRLEMRAELARIQERVGTSFVHVTHNQEDAMSIADEILLLRDGRVQQFGDPLELFEAPKNEFVADFIGTPSMNLLDARLDDGAAAGTDVETVGGTDEREIDADADAGSAAAHGDGAAVDGGGAVVDAGGFSLTVPGDRARAAARRTDGRVRLGLRPSKLRAVLDGSPRGPSFGATVSMVETFGDANWYYLDAGVDEPLVMKSADEDVLESLTDGDDLQVTVAPGDVHLFDPETGEALG
jgi:multiple sugar transport system ATP-binding protein